MPLTTPDWLRLAGLRPFLLWPTAPPTLLGTKRPRQSRSSCLDASRPARRPNSRSKGLLWCLLFGGQVCLVFSLVQYCGQQSVSTGGCRGLCLKLGNSQGKLGAMAANALVAACWKMRGEKGGSDSSRGLARGCWMSSSRGRASCGSARPADQGRSSSRL